MFFGCGTGRDVQFRSWGLLHGLPRSCSQGIRCRARRALVGCPCEAVPSTEACKLRCRTIVSAFLHSTAPCRTVPHNSVPCHTLLQHAPTPPHDPPGILFTPYRAVQVYDAQALRVIVDDGDDGGQLREAIDVAYRLVGAVHSIWKPIKREFDDYIANPKPSGYQALHTGGRWAEGKEWKCAMGRPATGTVRTGTSFSFRRRIVTMIRLRTPFAHEVLCSR